MTRLLVKAVSSLRGFWYRLTGGRVGARMNGMDVLLLTTRGRKSGKTRTTPIQFMADGDRYVVVASNGGSDRHPGWWLNLRREPRATVQVKSARRSVRAEEATPSEKAELWPRLTELYRGYAVYQGATSRQIPVVILHPDAA